MIQYPLQNTELAAKIYYGKPKTNKSQQIFIKAGQ